VQGHKNGKTNQGAMNWDERGGGGIKKDSNMAAVVPDDPIH
jgi:hypothetical protein